MGQNEKLYSSFVSSGFYNFITAKKYLNNKFISYNL